MRYEMSKTILWKLQEFNGNIFRMAEAIGIERSNLYKKIKAYGIPDFRGN